MLRKEIPMSSVILMLVALNIGMGFATLGVYNFGYISTGELVGCQSGRAIIYTGVQEAYSEIWCPIGMNYKIYIFLGGALSVFGFGFIFFLMRKVPMRFLSFVIWGLGLYLNHKNIGIFGVHPVVQWVVALSGILLIIYGEDRFVTETGKLISA